ncbi:Thioredoxin- transmembrane protein 1 [Nowakowskiella sp. JEL0407]|nr:Thioredoxin- transmembrane protein 1 [Nowakowskiella sp. JEL0407]
MHITKLFTILLLLPLALSHRTNNSPIPHNPLSKVEILTDENFSAIVNSNEEWIIEFYANWCGACRNYAPQFDIFAGKVHDELPGVRVGKVDVDANPSLTSKFYISSLPSVFHLKSNSKLKCDSEESGQCDIKSEKQTSDKYFEVRSLQAQRQIDTLFAIIRDETWKDIEPWNSIWSPFGIIAKALGLVGNLGKLVNSGIDFALERIPWWVLVIIMAVLIFGLALVAVWATVSESSEMVKPEVKPAKTRRETKKVQ